MKQPSLIILVILILFGTTVIAQPQYDYLKSLDYITNFYAEKVEKRGDSYLIIGKMGVYGQSRFVYLDKDLKLTEKVIPPTKYDGQNVRAVEVGKIGENYIVFYTYSPKKSKTLHLAYDHFDPESRTFRGELTEITSTPVENNSTANFHLQLKFLEYPSLNRGALMVTHIKQETDLMSIKWTPVKRDLILFNHEMEIALKKEDFSLSAEYDDDKGLIEVSDIFIDQSDHIFFLAEKVHEPSDHKSNSEDLSPSELIIYVLDTEGELQFSDVPLEKKMVSMSFQENNGELLVAGTYYHGQEKNEEFRSNGLFMVPVNFDQYSFELTTESPDYMEYDQNFANDFNELSKRKREKVKSNDLRATVTEIVYNDDGSKLIFLEDQILNLVYETGNGILTPDRLDNMYYSYDNLAVLKIDPDGKKSYVILPKNTRIFDVQEKRRMEKGYLMFKQEDKLVIIQNGVITEINTEKMTHNRHVMKEWHKADYSGPIPVMFKNENECYILHYYASGTLNPVVMQLIRLKD